MGKVITVWGSPGSGKSMFCCILAKALTRDKRKAIIINADMNVPRVLWQGAWKEVPRTMCQVGIPH